jgi:hypothetical protein
MWTFGKISQCQRPPDTAVWTVLDLLCVPICAWLCTGYKLRSFEQPCIQVKMRLLMTSDNRRTCEGGIKTNHWPTRGAHKKGNQPQHRVPQKNSKEHGKSWQIMARRKQCNIVQHSATIATVATAIQGANPTVSGHRKGSSSRPAKRDADCGGPCGKPRG